MAVSEEVFKIESVRHSDNVVRVILSVIKGSPVFKGHFPGQPVVPGACMLQLVKDILAGALGYTVKMMRGSSLKFVGMIEPGADNVLTLELGYKVIDEEISVNAKLSNENRVCFKYQGIFKRD